MLISSPKRMTLACQLMCGVSALVASGLVLGFIWVVGHLLMYCQHFADSLGLLFDAEAFTNWQQIMLVALLAAPLLALLYGLWRLFSLFRVFAQANYFSRAAVQHLLWFSLMLLIAVFLSVLVHIAASILMTINNPAGLRAVSVSFGSTHLILILQAGVFSVIAWVLAEGERISQENAEFI